MKKRAIILLSMLLILISGCNKDSSTDEKPVYNVQSDSISVSSSDPCCSEENLSGHENVFNPDFKGVTITMQTPKIISSPFANMSNQIVSYDEETDTLYYANYQGRFGNEDDYYLYSFKDGKSELILEMPVNYINYYNGAVYFTSNEDILALYGLYPLRPEGKLYKYNLFDKTIETLVEENVYNVIIYEDYIYYTTSPIVDNELKIIVGGRLHFRIPVSGGEPEYMDDLRRFFYGEYQIRETYNEEKGFLLELVSEQKTERITGYIKGGIDRNFCILENKLWFNYLEGTKHQIASVDLQTGETKIYGNGFDYGADFTFVVLDNEIYACEQNKNAVYKYNEENNEFVFAFGSDPERSPRERKPGAQAVLTDGKYIYALTLDSSGDFKDWRNNLIRLVPIGNEKFKEVVIY